MATGIRNFFTQQELIAVEDVTITASAASNPGATTAKALVVSIGGSASGTSSPQIQGNVAHDGVDAGNPIKIGGYGSSTAPTAVSSGDRVNGWFLLNGATATTVVGATGNIAVVGTAGDGLSGQPGMYTFGQNTVFNGASWDRQRGDTVGVSAMPGLSSTFWNYAAASGGITNTTTAVTIKAAAGASVRNYVTGIDITADTLGAATEVAIRDGAAGTVLWRTKIQTTGLTPVKITFPTPLKGTANTLLEVVTLTATVTGSVYVNVQGFTGA